MASIAYLTSCPALSVTNVISLLYGSFVGTNSSKI
ncbi:hypothetical protein BAZSYMB_GCONTIG00838_0 [Bathymodiolus azoricus thioautotrophic gill symbiont]|uniref:Uncharacterized protein n=1 Tax=Bathymodiolus azoricus thioautotrophic gill symbiont TaxID=235205 RepID=A0A1H6K6E5_9GAMM|nr:hypothetical protein BAZSYMB_GCONTIG00838_0 [Bathymodiolus azoricus thioautotrophic gill symbiont]